MNDDFSHLDEDQMRAVKHVGNALVIAGAGSGKTTTIVAKIKYLIKMGYQEHEILVISFTNESVNSLKQRINYNIAIKTFHKLALDLVNDDNIKVSPDNYLDYIINEYLHSYALDNPKTKRIINRLYHHGSQDNLILLIKTFINLYKANYQNINYLFKIYKSAFLKNRDYLRIILEIYQIYLRELESCGLLDFNDMIVFATTLIKRGKRKTTYKYIIIDEFQDTSAIRFELITSMMAQSGAHLFVVGDDYQSIYRFSGCDLDIFLNISQYISNTEILFLNHNYRNPQMLADIAGQFVLKNNRQMPKQIICHKDINKPIIICFYTNKRMIVNQVLERISGEVLILGRNNRDKDEFGITENENVRFLTIHKAKGLEADNVILINLENSNLGFPSKIKNEEILSKVLKKDYILYEEERRLMYVALTRTRNKIYLLVPRDNYSVFVKELIWHHYQSIEIINKYP